MILRTCHKLSLEITSPPIKKNAKEVKIKSQILYFPRLPNSVSAANLEQLQAVQSFGGWGWDFYAWIVHREKNLCQQLSTNKGKNNI